MFDLGGGGAGQEEDDKEREGKWAWMGGMDERGECGGQNPQMG